VNINREAMFMAAGIIAVVRLLPVLDGWVGLVARYGGGSGAGGEVFRLVPARGRGLGVYMRVVVTPAGLGIRVRLPPWHPPIFIPWPEMVYCVPAGLVSRSGRILCRHAESVPIHLVGRAGRTAVAGWVTHRSRT
jgi:hypothetical protein